MAKTALLWGANGGLGRALAQALRSDEWQVIGVSRDGRVSAEVDHSLQADVARDMDVRSAVMAASQLVDQIDTMIYSVGELDIARTDALTPESWQRQLDANLTGAFLTTHHSLPLLADDAPLVYVGAVSERLKLPGFGAYVAAKAGLEAYAATLRKEQRGRAVTVVRPGAVDTPFWDDLPIKKPKDAASAEKVAARICDAIAEGHSGTLDLV